MTAAALWTEAAGPRPLNLRRLVERIWTVRGSLPLDPALAPEAALARLDPLFQEYGTTVTRDQRGLAYDKKDPGAQDPLATFDSGSLAVVEGGEGAVLTWRLVSKSLLACFFAPLLFLAFAQTAVLIGDHLAASADAKADKKDEKKEPVLYQNPLDKALGAPAPEKPKDDEKKKDAKKERKLSPTPGYVFAGIFAVLYIVGRVLEPMLVRRRFRRLLEQG
ncbi:hypothetical protein [Novosphingobium olei]|uniref:hypothetical protein n=1 Tax=Novosphingobium olei TaxID=2728851 RepID=UPI001F10AA7F|nr:hypothetical protein [Novosphingobium olei]